MLRQSTDTGFEHPFRAFASAAVAASCWLTLSCDTFAPSDDAYRALIRRTEGGIPHIEADDMGSLGFGTLYAMAEDNVCILADQYLSFAAERSVHLGSADGNLERDFFYQMLIDRGQGAEALPPDLEQLFQGSADGYNHYLSETGTHALPDPGCRGAAWVRPITALDVKRISRADYALAYMLPIVVAAAPPNAPGAATPALRADAHQFAAAIDAYLEIPKQGGSNGIAIGRDASESGQGMLLANPHMAWNDAFQRFYPMHQTLNGRFDALGATLIGRPRVGFGTTEHLAWTSTVSTAKRVSFYRLALVPGDPTRYRFDGEVHPMQHATVKVRARSPTGEIEEHRHTFYSTHFGALLIEDENFAWTREHAYAVRMPDSGWRGELSALEQLQAKSVREMKAIHDRYQFLTVNLIAADRHGEVLYGDLGPVPHITDAQVEACGVMNGGALDGSRSECQWGRDADAVVPGIFGPSRLPFLFRDDFVTNSNDSYWLTNPAEPLTGFPRSLGSERQPRTLRTRSGLDMVLRHLRDGTHGDGKISLDELQQLTLANENYAGELIRDDVVELCRANPHAQLPDGTTVSLVDACEVLAEWDLHANLDSRGAHVFRQLLAQANHGAYTRTLPASFEPRLGFDASNAVATPSGLAPASHSAVLQSLAKAVHELETAGIPLNARLGTLQGVSRNNDWIPLHGGPEYEGIFNKLEAKFQGGAGYPEVTRASSSWILAVEFTAAGPRARGILAYSLSGNPASPHYADQTRLFSGKRWLEIPFAAKDVEAETLHELQVGAPRNP